MHLKHGVFILRITFPFRHILQYGWCGTQCGRFRFLTRETNRRTVLHMYWNGFVRLEAGTSGGKCCPDGVGPTKRHKLIHTHTHTCTNKQT